MIEKIYQINELSELENYLKTFANQNELQEKLFNEFLIFADYKNADEWNKAVRLCECLAIVGWGEKEPLEAVTGSFISGNPWTYFYDKFGRHHFVESIWSKSKTGLIMGQGRTSYHQSPNQQNTKTSIEFHYPVSEQWSDTPLAKQRNWIVKSPIYTKQFINNCYRSSAFLKDSLEKELNSLIDTKMRPKLYGSVIDFISIFVNLSWKNCQYVIDETIKSIDYQNPHLVPRIRYGNFRKNTGRLTVDIYLEKAFSDLNQNEQKAKMAEYLLIAIKTIAQKQKKLDYDFELMIADFEKVLNLWLNKA